MSSSWNFPARASLSYECSEPSRAGALQFPSWNRAEIFLISIKNYNQISPFSYSIMIITNSNQLHYHIYEFMGDKMCFRKFKSMILLHKFKKKKKKKKSARFRPIFDFDLKGKSSRAEPSWKSLSSSSGSSQLGSDSSLVGRCVKKDKKRWALLMV
jgi:hypothetical protein